MKTCKSFATKTIEKWRKHKLFASYSQAICDKNSRNSIELAAAEQTHSKNIAICFCILFRGKPSSRNCIFWILVIVQKMPKKKPCKFAVSKHLLATFAMYLLCRFAMFLLYRNICCANLLCRFAVLKTLALQTATCFASWVVDTFY